MASVLAVFSSYSVDEHDPSLSDALVRELVGDGHEVTVVAFSERSEDLARERRASSPPVHLVRLPHQRRIWKYLMAWPALVAVLLRLRFSHGRKHFDHLIVQAPLSVKAPAVLLLWLFDVGRATTIVFDIFPRHQVEVGALAAGLERPLHAIEGFLVSRFDTVTAMGERNRAVIRGYYLDDDDTADIRIVPPWSAQEPEPPPPDPPDHASDATVRVLFGGQIVPGRRVDLLVRFLDQVRSPELDVQLWIYSWGPTFEALATEFPGSDWVHFQPRVNRSEYGRLLHEFDVGAVVTDDRVSLPALPSKLVAYSQHGLPSICLVEASSELFTVACGVECVHLNTFEFTEDAVDRAREFLSYARSDTAARKAREFGQRFRVEHARAEIMRQP